MVAGKVAHTRRNPSRRGDWSWIIGAAGGWERSL